MWLIETTVSKIKIKRFKDQRDGTTPFPQFREKMESVRFIEL